MRFGEIPPPPTYPEYEELLAQARRNASGPVDARTFPAKQEIMRQRGDDWCLAVLGKYAYHLGMISAVEAELIVLADARDLNPPLPPWVLEGREETARREKALEEQRAERRRRDKEAWDAAREQSPVELEVRANTKTRSRYDVGRDSLRHAVPAVEVVSGRRRRHLAGRALCETVTRAKPLVLGEPTTDPATCKSCLEHAPKIRAVEVPASA